MLRQPGHAQAGVKHLVWSTQEDPRGHLPDDMPFHSKQPGRKLSVVEVKADIEVSQLRHEL